MAKQLRILKYILLYTLPLSFVYKNVYGKPERPTNTS